MDLALLVIVTKALLGDRLGRPSLVATQFPLIGQPLEIPPMTSLDVAEAYVSADTAVARLTFAEWRQLNPGGTMTQYGKYITGFV